jgi:hypothetical protein
MSNRARNAGNGFERKIVQIFNQLTTNKKYTNKELDKVDDSEFKLLPKLGTTRKLSRFLDSKGIDVTTENARRIDEFPYLIQAKCYSTLTVNYSELLKKLKDSKVEGIPVVFHQQTKKATTKFIVQGEYACLYMEDFIDMIYEIVELKQKLKGNGDKTV